MWLYFFSGVLEHERTTTMIGPVIRAASVNAVARSYHLQLFGRQMIQKRNSGPWYYRDLPPHDKRLAQLANGI